MNYQQMNSYKKAVDKLKNHIEDNLEPLFNDHSDEGHFLFCKVILLNLCFIPVPMLSLYSLFQMNFAIILFLTCITCMIFYVCTLSIPNYSKILKNIHRKKGIAQPQKYKAEVFDLNDYRQ